MGRGGMRLWCVDVYVNVLNDYYAHAHTCRVDQYLTSKYSSGDLQIPTLSIPFDLLVVYSGISECIIHGRC
jgi:hypothetical protein